MSVPKTVKILLLNSIINYLLFPLALDCFLFFMSLFKEFYTLFNDEKKTMQQMGYGVREKYSEKGSNNIRQK